MYMYIGALTQTVAVHRHARVQTRFVNIYKAERLIVIIIYDK